MERRTEPLRGGDPAIDRFVEGDPQTTAEALATIRRAVRSRGFYIPVEERTEVVQEATVHLLRHLNDPSRERPRDFGAFVRTIAYRRCVDWMRRHRPTEAVDEERPGGGASPEASVLQKERLRIGAFVLSSLKASCVDLIRRYTVEGMTFRQIAEADGRLEKTVRNRMYKCLDQARALVERMRRRERLGLRAFDGSS